MNTRLTEIYCIAIDVITDNFDTEISEIAETKSQEKFNSLSKAVQRKMIADGNITADDASTYFMLLSDAINKAINDVLYIKMTTK